MKERVTFEVKMKTSPYFALILFCFVLFLELQYMVLFVFILFTLKIFLYGRTQCDKF